MKKVCNKIVFNFTIRRKPVTLEVYDDAIIRDVTHNQILSDNMWKMNVTVFMDVGYELNEENPLDGLISVNLEGVFAAAVTKHIYIPVLEDLEVSITIPISVKEDDVKLWWPNGYGAQNLYALTVSWQGENRNINTNEVKGIPSKWQASSKTVRMGFRTIELIEESIEGGNTFYFRINKIPVFIKGSNWIPMDILPEKMFDYNKLKSLMLAVRDANMNTVRVWGGGVYESDQFYNLADEYGILVWQDMMFACAMYPVFPEFLESVQTELAQNIRRIQSHSSILLWSGNNENEAALVQNW